MQHFAAVVFGWMVAVVAVVSFISGPAAAASIAGNSLGTVGMTAGAIVGGADDLFNGFKLGQNAANKTGPSQKGGTFGGAGGAAALDRAARTNGGG